jgi:prolyl oligopeptidase
MMHVRILSPAPFSYSHIEITSGVKYPAVMLTTGINDPRVEPWLSAKIAARLQAATSSGKPVLLRVDYGAGHGSGLTKKQRNEAQADIFLFLFQQLNAANGRGAIANR